MSTCVAIVPGCKDCADQVGRGEHVCDDLCSFDGEQKRASEEYHRVRHDPRRCVGCGSILNDRKGNDRAVAKPCPEGCCRRWCCPDCDATYASDGPVGCPSCSPISRTAKVVMPVFMWLVYAVGWVARRWSR